MGFDYKSNFEKFDNMTMQEQNKWRGFYNNAKWIFPAMFLFIFVSKGWIISICLFIYFIYGLSIQGNFFTYRECLRRNFQNLSDEEKKNFKL